MARESVDQNGRMRMLMPGISLSGLTCQARPSCWAMWTWVAPSRTPVGSDLGAKKASWVRSRERRQMVGTTGPSRPGTVGARVAGIMVELEPDRWGMAMLEWGRERG